MNCELQNKFLLRLDSHRPSAIQTDSLVETESASQDEIQPGDLIVYCGDKNYNCHRVLYRKTSDGMLWYFTKPDGCLEPEGWIPAYRLMGKVIRINHVSLQMWELRLGSVLLLWHSRIQWWAYRSLFYSRLGKWMGEKRAHYLSPKPLFKDWFAKLSSPWLLSPKASA